MEYTKEEQKQAQQILNRVRMEKEIEQYQEAQSIVKYFKLVEEGKKVVAKAYPEIPESERDLYL